VNTPANARRVDIGSVYPSAGPDHGFTLSVPLTAGVNQVCVYAINVPSPANNPLLGCRQLTLEVVPVGNFESVTGGATTMTVTGWAVDPETSAPIGVHVYVDGANVAMLTADRSRPDVAAARPGAGAAHGFQVEVPVAPGKRTVCVYAINVGQGGENPLLGCRPVDVGVRPVGRIETTVSSGYSARVTGWAIDPDTSAPIDVHLYVDGVYTQAVTASGVRPDVAAVYPAAGAAHGFDTVLSLGVGRHVVCAFGINVLGAVGNPQLSCSAVVVGNGEALPFGMLDSATTTNGITSVTGWSVDPDVPATSLETHYYVDGRFSGRTIASEARPDVAAAYRGVGAAHGYTGYFVLSPGRHTVCTFAMNQGRGSVNPALGCAVVTVP